MKIELDEPFKSLWRKGYLREGKKDGRKRVDLVNSAKHRTTISYARYLKSVEIGEVLSDEFEVDHINMDRTDDRLENLQVLTKENHREKTAEEITGRDIIKLKCGRCGVFFEKDKTLLHPDQLNTFCSRSCNAKFYSENNPQSSFRSVSDDLKDQISHKMREGLSGRRIAKELGISGSTACKYMKIFKSVLQ